MKQFGEFFETRVEGSVVCFLRIQIFLLPTIRVCLFEIGERKRSGSVCAVGVVTLRVVCVEVVYFRSDGGRNGGDEEVRYSLGF